MKTKLLMLLGGMLLASCGGTTDEDPFVSAWALFVDGKYSEAHAEFVTLITVDAGNAQAGLGWVTLKMDSLSASDGYFALAATDSLIHAYAGWSFIAWQKKDYTNAITRAEFVLRKTPDFVFEFDGNVTKNTLILTMAQSHFYLAQYQSCIDNIKLLDPGYTAPALNDADIKTKLLSKLEALSGLS